MATRYFTDADIDEMVFLAKKYGSYRRAAKEFGCSYQAVIDHCHERGFHIAGPHERCKAKKHKIVNGYVFYWCKKGYYRGNVGNERLMLSDYCYRLKFGQAKPARAEYLVHRRRPRKLQPRQPRIRHRVRIHEAQKLGPGNTRNEPQDIRGRTEQEHSDGKEETVACEAQRTEDVENKENQRPGQHQRNEGCTDKAKECGRTRIFLHTGANRTP